MTARASGKLLMLSYFLARAFKIRIYTTGCHIASLDPERGGAHEVGRTAYVTACGVCLLLALHESQAFEDPCRERLEVVSVLEMQIDS